MMVGGVKLFAIDGMASKTLDDFRILAGLIISVALLSKRMRQELEGGVFFFFDGDSLIKRLSIRSWHAVYHCENSKYLGCLENWSIIRDAKRFNSSFFIDERETLAKFIQSFMDVFNFELKFSKKYHVMAHVDYDDIPLETVAQNFLFNDGNLLATHFLVSL